MSAGHRGERTGGLMKKGDCNWGRTRASKYTDEDKQYAKKLYFQGHTLKEVKEVTGMSMGLISDIVNDMSIRESSNKMSNTKQIYCKAISNMGSDLKPIRIDNWTEKLRFVDYIILEWLKVRENHGKQCRNNI